MTVNPRTSTWPRSSATASLSLAPGYVGRGGGLGVVFGAVVVVVVLVLLAVVVLLVVVDVVVGGGSLGVTGAASLDDTVGVVSVAESSGATAFAIAPAIPTTTRNTTTPMTMNRRSLLLSEGWPWWAALLLSEVGGGGLAPPTSRGVPLAVVRVWSNHCPEFPSHHRSRAESSGSGYQPVGGLVIPRRLEQQTRV